LKIILAGFNLDYETIKEARAASPAAEQFTPETVSAAYARISRNPAPVNELRAAARKEVEKARRSNQAIVFDMGHSSIAEHAVFNIDVLGVSRLLVEEIEKFRLCSYTEKSQRYVLLQDDFVIPREIREAGLTESFTRTVKAQNHSTTVSTRACCPGSSTRTKGLPRSRRTAPCWKAGPRRMRATYSALPRRPNSG